MNGVEHRIHETRIDNKIVQQQKELALLIKNFAHKDGFTSTANPSLYFIILQDNQGYLIRQFA